MLIKKSILSMRSEEARNTSIDNPKYSKLLNKAGEIDDMIRALIPEDKQKEYLKLSNKLFCAEAEVQKYENKAVYKQGFYDGLEIAVRLLKHKANK